MKRIGLPKLMFAAMQRMDRTWEGANIDHQIADGDVLPFGPLQVIHMPGHCAGQIALLWPDRRVLAQVSFDTACFGHGGAIVGGADERFRKSFGSKPGCLVAIGLWPNIP